MMKNLMLAGALLAVLSSSALAEDPYDANDPYRSDARHLNGQSQGTGDWAQSGSVAVAPSTYGAFNTNDGPNGTVIRGGEVVGQDPDPAVRAQLGAEVDERGNN
jgi:opacity protein-like surface antigen